MSSLNKVKLLLSELEEEISSLPNDFNRLEAFDGSYKIFLAIERYEKKKIEAVSDKSLDSFTKHLLETAKTINKIKHGA